MSTTGEKLKARFPDLQFVKLLSPEEHGHFNPRPFLPGTSTLPKGHLKEPDRKPFPVDVIYDRDQAIPMRDGIRIYTDVFRPVDSDTVKVPALLPWSPYGKTGTGPQQYDTMGPFRFGLARDRTSGYEKFEGPDPADWCERGYAIISVDARGAAYSEGNISSWGEQEAEDIYDTLTWVSKQPWCNGSVGMMGNSWLAIAQINFASRHTHPALKAIAPMEAFNDPYRDIIARGGKPHLVGFNSFISRGFAGPGYSENIAAMLKKRPFYDDYWKSKFIDTSKIDENLPLYVLASYSSCLHTRGSFNTFRTAKGKKKWLRVHPYQEWYDLYRPEINDELQRYFDTYCKGIETGWETDMPPVRLSLLACERSATRLICERPEKEYPLARQQLKTYYLDASEHVLKESVPSATKVASHNGHDVNAQSDFTLYFDEDTELVGYPSVKLWMSCKEHNDMDVAVQIRKISASGQLLEHLNYPCPVPVEEVPDVNTAKTLGPQGFLRASHAVTKSEELSHGNEFYYNHDRSEPIKPGTIVSLDITLWPIGMVFAKGEGIMLRISGHDMCLPEFELVRVLEADDANVGVHNVHTGKEYPSSLTLPVIPVKKL